MTKTYKMNVLCPLYKVDSVNVLKGCVAWRFVQCLATIVDGRASDNLFECPAEVLRILIAEIVCNFANRLIAAHKHVFGRVHHFLSDIVDGCSAGFFLYEVTEIVG